MARRLIMVLLVVAAFALASFLLVRGLQSHPNARWRPADVQPLSDLAIVFHPDATGRHTQRFTLRCNPAGGSLPEPAAACRQIAKANPFSPQPKGVACSMIFAGPQTAYVHGLWRNRPVRVTLARRNSCETGRFRFLDVLVSGHAVAAAGPQVPTTGG